MTIKVFHFDVNVLVSMSFMIFVIFQEFARDMEETGTPVFLIL